ncbi:MAG: type II toxin-antitoxin system HicB family antitoxin [Chthoniobacteraceae bacterium]
MQTLTAMLHQGEPDEGGFWATCLEVPGANGQGETREECLKDLAEAVKLILLVNEEEALRDDPKAVKNRAGSGLISRETEGTDSAY